MDPALNPYSPGAGLRPPDLAGREREIGDFAVLRQRVTKSLMSRSIVMSGLRGVGKTVLLNELASAARADDWIVGKVEADRGESRRTFREQVAGTMNRALREATGSRDLVGRLRGALSTFKAFSLRTDPSGGFAIGIEIDAARGRADTGHLGTDLADLFLELAAAAKERAVGVALFVDELQDLAADELGALCQACHEAGQQDAPFYLVGAGLPSLPRLLADARSYAERLFDYWSIGALSDQASTEALVRPARSAGVDWEAAASALVVTGAASYPYFLQEFGKATWDYAPGPTITVADAEAGLQVGAANLDRGFFTSRWERATPAERGYLQAMASDGNPLAFSGEVARRLGKRPGALGPVRASLIHKGLIYAPEHGAVAFTVPGMAAFIARQSQA